MNVGETPQRANDSHASLPTAWQTTSLTGPKPAQGAITGANAKTNIYPGKWFSGERLLMQLHSGSRRCCSPLPRHLSELMITLVYCVLKSRDWPPFFCNNARRIWSACEWQEQAFLKTCLHTYCIVYTVKVLFNSIADEGVASVKLGSLISHPPGESATVCSVCAHKCSFIICCLWFTSSSSFHNSSLFSLCVSGNCSFASCVAIGSIQIFPLSDLLSHFYPFPPTHNIYLIEYSTYLACTLITPSDPWKDGCLKRIKTDAAEPVLVSFLF